MNRESQADNLRLAQYVSTFTRLRELDARQLVELALNEMPENLLLPYEQIIEELCSRVYPNWVNDTPEPLTLTQAMRLGESPGTVP